MLVSSEYKNRQEVLKALEDLKARFPAHSLKPAMMQELEDLEELLAQFPATDDVFADGDERERIK